MSQNKYTVSARVWLYTGNGAWHFVTIPKVESADIRARFEKNARGWGSLPVIVTVGKTSWKTSIFPDKKSEGYLLPLKSAVRKKEGIFEGDTISFSVEIKP